MRGKSMVFSAATTWILPAREVDGVLRGDHLDLAFATAPRVDVAGVWQQRFDGIGGEALVGKMPVVEREAQTGHLLDEREHLRRFFNDGSRVRLNGKRHPGRHRPLDAPCHFLRTAGGGIAAAFRRPVDARQRGKMPRATGLGKGERTLEKIAGLAAHGGVRMVRREVLHRGTGYQEQIGDGQPAVSAPRFEFSGGRRRIFQRGGGLHMAAAFEKSHIHTLETQ